MGRPPPPFFSPPVFVLRFLPLFSGETAGRSMWGGFMRKIGSGIAYKDFPGPLLPGFFPFFVADSYLSPASPIYLLFTLLCIQYQNCQIYISYMLKEHLQYFSKLTFLVYLGRLDPFFLLLFCSIHTFSSSSGPPSPVLLLARDPPNTHTHT